MSERLLALGLRAGRDGGVARRLLALGRRRMAGVSLEQARACRAGWRFGRDGCHGCRGHGRSCGMRCRGGAGHGGDCGGGSGGVNGVGLPLHTPGLWPHGACMAGWRGTVGVAQPLAPGRRGRVRRGLRELARSAQCRAAQRGRSVVGAWSSSRRRWLQSRGGGCGRWRSVAKGSGVGADGGDVTLQRRGETGWVVVCVNVRVCAASMRWWHTKETHGEMGLG